jgi:GNAT superfamily N-acetyltransferase
VEIVGLDDGNRGLFAQCLEDWSPEAHEAGPRRAHWVEKFLPRGLRARLAVDERGTVGGMIQYLPVEQSHVTGKGLYFIPCVWVHGHKQGRGNFQGRGMGRALLQAAEEDARALGAAGLAAWGVWLPFWMRASWFKRQGFRKADRQGLAVLLYKPFRPDVEPPRWQRPARPLPAPQPGCVTVTSFVSGWCMAGNLTHERAKRAAAEFGDRVVFHEVDTSEPASAAEWGRTDEVFVDGRKVNAGPPPSYDKLRAVMARRVRRL